MLPAPIVTACHNAQFTVMTTDVLSPSVDSVAPASNLLIILTWFGTFPCPPSPRGRG